MGHCDDELARAAAHSLPGGPGVDNAPWSALGDVCFMAASELSLKCQELKELTVELTRRRTLSTCAGALRRARRALISVDDHLAQLLALAPSLDLREMLEEAREIRKQYSVLRRTADGDGPPAGPALAMRLRAVDLRIALLADKDLYAKLRVDDRIELELLQGRLRTWLEGERNETAGMRLWQDTVGFMQLLSHVNLRSELRARDVALVGTMLAQLEQSEHDAIDEALCEALRPLLGLHDRLDDLLRLSERSRAPYLAVVRDLAARLLPSAEAAVVAAAPDAPDAPEAWTSSEPATSTPHARLGAA
jgi:hypothetical protein